MKIRNRYDGGADERWRDALEVPDGRTAVAADEIAAEAAHSAPVRVVVVLLRMKKS